MADRLPEELLMDILARLPVEDLVRFITVCKQWYSLITNPNFISLHIKRASDTANSSNNSLLLVSHYHCDPIDGRSYTEQNSLQFDNDSFGEYKSNLGFPFIVANPNSRFIDCLNGVVCVSANLQTYMCDIVLWNPSIQKPVMLPEPLVTYQSHGLFMHAVGFGFNPVTNDYEVVRVVHLCGNRNSIIPPMVEVFELSVGSWRSVYPKGFPYLVHDRSSQTFLNGTIHWLGYKHEERNSPLCNVIVTFDLESEVLDVVMLPDSLVVTEPLLSGPPCSVVSKLGESLSLIQHAPTTYGCYSSSVWVMKEYGLPDSWTKLFTIDRTGDLWEVFGFRRNGEVLASEGASIVSYDPKSNQLKHIHRSQRLFASFNVENYVESLALLGVKQESMSKATNNTVCSEGSPNVGT